MAAVERAFRDRIEQAERRHHRAGGQDFDFQVAAGHVVDLLGEVECVLVEDVFRRPGALEAQARGLRTSQHGRGQRTGGACGDRGIAKETTARGGWADGFLRHDDS